MFEHSEAGIKRYLNQYIDGAWVESDGGSRHQVINPATEQPCTEITFGTAADVDKAVTAARRAFESFSQTSVDTRVALLEAIIAAYKTRRQANAAAIAREMGCPRPIAATGQVGPRFGHLRDRKSVV